MVFEDPRCLRCYRCCVATEMILLPSDIERIERLGIARESFCYVDESGFYRLRNARGRCVFLREDGRCAIYSHRPLGCVLYPLVFDELEGPRIDDECPLAREFERRCVELELGIELLRRFLRELEEFYGYRVDWRVFEEGARNLLSRCLATS